MENMARVKGMLLLMINEGRRGKMKRSSEMAPLEPSRGGRGSVFLYHPDWKHADPSKSSNRHRPSTMVSMLEKNLWDIKICFSEIP